MFGRNKEEVTPNVPALSINAELLISEGIKNNIPIEAMQKLLDMRTQLKAEYAREGFYRALSKFQRECPVIEKRKVVLNSNGSVRYKYAPLEDIQEQVSPHIEENGFSYTFKTKQGADYLTIICEAHHAAGHTEETEVTVQISNDGFMNNIQKVGSAITYAKRYSFCNAFGIMTGDEDTDGNGEPPKTYDATPLPESRSAPARQSAPSQQQAPAAKPVAPVQTIKLEVIHAGETIPPEYWAIPKEQRRNHLETGCITEKINGVWTCVRKSA